MLSLRRIKPKLWLRLDHRGVDDLPDKIGDLYKFLRHMLGEHEIESPDLESRFMIEERTGHGWSTCIANPNTVISPAALEAIRTDIDMRLSGMPLSRIHGRRQFWGLEFLVTPDTLDPRPDTETLIEKAIDRFRNHPPTRILDLGTGTGCILISLLKEFPNAHGIGVDRSIHALSIAKENARRNQVDTRVSFLCGDWMDSLGSSFDLIVSNPPYIASGVIPFLSPEVKNHDPILALDGGADGLDAYKKIFSSLKFFLNKGGHAFFEIGYDQKNDVMRLAEESGFLAPVLWLDLAGQPRVVEISGGDK